VIILINVLFILAYVNSWIVNRPRMKVG